MVEGGRMSELDTQRRLQAIEDRLERLRKADAGMAFGTFTPTFAGSGGGGSFTLLVATGEWTRIGNRVDVWIHLQMNTFTSAPSGNLWVTTLPFTARNTASQFYAQSIGYRDTSLATIITAAVPANTTRVQFYTTAGALVAASVLGASSELVIGGSFAL